MNTKVKYVCRHIEVPLFLNQFSDGVLEQILDADRMHDLLKERQATLEKLKAKACPACRAKAKAVRATAIFHDTGIQIQLLPSGLLSDSEQELLKSMGFTFSLAVRDNRFCGDAEWFPNMREFLKIGWVKNVPREAMDAELEALSTQGFPVPEIIPEALLPEIARETAT